jgi:RimJ/RimL family protein N-acetyltransferase
MIRRRMQRFEPVPFVRQAGLRVALRAATEKVACTRVSLGLRCDLLTLPAILPGKVPIRMSARDARSYAGFDFELNQAGGADYLEALRRTWMCASGVTTLYVADALDGRPIYAQWLIRKLDDWRLQNKPPHDVLADDEVLLEGAYTFVAFRGVGAMADGMGQLLRIARDEGSAAAITYVHEDNVPSLRGCARVGFVLDHVRVNTTRFGRERSDRQLAEAAAQRAWESATTATSRRAGLA